MRPGEIVGLYGLVGSGVSEIAACVYGIDRPTSGRDARCDGKRDRPAVAAARRSGAGIALLPANRKVEGMFSFQSIAFNISAGHLQLLSRLGVFVDRARERTVAKDLIKRLAVRTPHERQPISAMSGGNAQKVVLARQLVERPEVLVLAEPTQGVDVGAKEEIHRIIAELADDGTAVLVVTSDLPEALRIADRLLVVRGGTTTVEFGPRRHARSTCSPPRRAPWTRRQRSHERHDDPHDRGERPRRHARATGSCPRRSPARSWS